MVINSEKEQLQDNLKNAVCNCEKLKIGKYCLKSSFAIKVHSFKNLTDEKYEDGKHLYKIDCTIDISNNKGEYIEERCGIHFDAQIRGTDVKIINGTVLADKDFIPFTFTIDNNS